MAQVGTSPTARLELDLERPGKTFGHIALAQSTNVSGWGELHIPIVGINSGEGPTVLLCGGTHGDEYESQLTLLRLVEEIDPAKVTGRLLVIPRLSGAASSEGTRLWPDGTNLNRAFPGDPDGSVPSRLADFMTRVLFPLADAVIDVHSGGRSMSFAPMATIQVPEDRELRRAMLAAASAWLTDLCYVVMFAADGAGLLNVEAQHQGKVVATAELGGAAMVGVDTLAIAERGITNLLRHLRVLEGSPSTRADLGLAPTQYVEIEGSQNYLRARDRGLFEPRVAPGAAVCAGQVIGTMRFPDHPDRPSEDLLSPYTGFACVVRAMPACEIGDALVVVGRVVDEIV